MVNIGSADRTIRFIVGVALLVAPFIPPLAGMLAGWGALKFVVALIGLVLVATAAMRFCPLYTFFGIRTCRIESK